MDPHDATEPTLGGVPSVPTPGVRLVVETPGEAPRLVFVPAGQRQRIGRASEQDLVLADTNVSRAHAEIDFDGRQVRVRDLGSSNGTFLGDRRVAAPTELFPGDEVRVGSTRIAVVLITPTQRASTDVAPESALPSGVLAPGVVAVDPASVATFRLLARLAPSRLPILLQGETGSGKEVAARALHAGSPRAAGPFVAVNCATLTEGLAESTLFGHERGSFTGATTRHRGVFEAADGGTLMLDEVGELSPASQARLLRVLQDGVVVRVGATVPVPVNVRVVAATNRDLVAAVSGQRFREDLYFRLNGATVVVPPLRARPLDIPALVAAILDAHPARVVLGPGVAATLRSYAWPGNVRELRFALEHALALCEGGVLALTDLPPAVRGDGSHEPPGEVDSPLQRRIDATERRAIIAALEAAGWNQVRAARALGITRRALIYRMERHGLKPRPNTASED